MKTNDINQFFDSIGSKRVLIIGDVMIDSYLWGNVERISPEAPVPVVSVSRRDNRLGGAANVGLNILSMGATPVMCSVIGNDEKGSLFLELMNIYNLDTSGIITDNNRKTTVKFRIISHGQHLLRVDEESDLNLDATQEKIFIQKITALLKSQHFDAIIFEDYDKGCITPEIIKEVVGLANRLNIPTLVDPKKRNFNAYTGVTLFKPNFKELVEGLKVEISKSDMKSVMQAATMLSERLKNRYTMVTLSENGIFIAEGNDYVHVPAEVRDIADVSGAGDTVISIAALCLACGLEKSDIAKVSNLAGGLVCEKVGVVPVDRNQLYHECIRYFNNNITDKQ